MDQSAYERETEFLLGDLARECHDQWLSNHGEHCGPDITHARAPIGKQYATCWWPAPKVLRSEYVIDEIHEGRDDLITHVARINSEGRLTA